MAFECTDMCSNAEADVYFFGDHIKDAAIWALMVSDNAATTEQRKALLANWIGSGEGFIDCTLTSNRFQDNRISNLVVTRDSGSDWVVHFAKCIFEQSVMSAVRGTLDTTDCPI